MSKQHHIIYVPGLRDKMWLNTNLVHVLTPFWKIQGFHSHILAPHWEEGTKFAPKQKLITDKIDELIKKGHTVSLIGQSAGGSAVMNAFCERRKVVNGVINCTGRLRAGVNVKPTLEVSAKISPAFKDACLLFEHKNEPTLTKSDRKKIMTIRPVWDEAVPASTVPLDGATNITLPFVEHIISGVVALTILSKIPLNFLRKLQK